MNPRNEHSWSFEHDFTSKSVFLSSLPGLSRINFYLFFTTIETNIIWEQTWNGTTLAIWIFLGIENHWSMFTNFRHLYEEQKAILQMYISYHDEMTTFSWKLTLQRKAEGSLVASVYFKKPTSSLATPLSFGSAWMPILLATSRSNTKKLCLVRGF